MKIGRRNSSEDSSDEESPAWLTSYSDMMTDLLAIFVILFSFAMMNSKQVVNSTSTTASDKEAAIIAAEENTASEKQAELNILPTEEKFNSFVESLYTHISEDELSEQVSIVEQGNGVVLLRVVNSALFAPGRADIDSKAEELLDTISATLTEHTDFIKMIRIEGHTDNRPVNNKEFKSNWELSTSRAVNVLIQLLEISRLEPEKFSAVGYGEFHPIADNDTAEGRSLNRRVDFIIETENVND